jgi:hypothetical protein
MAERISGVYALEALRETTHRVETERKSGEDDIIARLAVAMWTRLGSNHYTDEVAPFWTPVQGADRAIHPIEAFRYNRGMRQITGPGTLVTVGILNNARKRHVFLLDHERTMPLPSGRYLFPSGQISTARINTSDYKRKTAHYVPALTARGARTGTNTVEAKKEIGLWQQIIGRTTIAPIVEITGEFIGSSSPEENRAIVRTLAPFTLAHPELRESLPEFMQDVIIPKDFQQ